LRDPDLGAEHGAVTRAGDRRHDFFCPTDDWWARGWHPIAVSYGLLPPPWVNRREWRARRYQRRKAWKRR
jgi:hypothetical protein